MIKLDMVLYAVAMLTVLTNYGSNFIRLECSVFNLFDLIRLAVQVVPHKIQGLDVDIYYNAKQISD